MKHSETVHLAISVPTAATATNPPNLLQRFEWNFHPQLFIELAVNLVPPAGNTAKMIAPPIWSKFLSYAVVFAGDQQ